MPGVGLGMQMSEGRHSHHGVRLSGWLTIHRDACGRGDSAAALPPCRVSLHCVRGTPQDSDDLGVLALIGQFYTKAQRPFQEGQAFHT